MLPKVINVQEMAKQTEVLKTTELLGQQFTVYGSIQEPLFVASDVATMINHPNTSELVKLVDDDEKLTSTILRAGQNRDVWMLTENGLYEVLMQSRKPIAKQFKKGVKQILHEIRTTGGYIATTSTMTDTEIMAKAILLANNTIEQRNARIKELEDTNEKQTNTIARLQPKAEFADAAFKADGKVDIGQAAKILGLPFGRNTLFKKLKEKGVFFGSRNEPKQRYIDAGYFELSQLPPIKRDHHPDLIVMKCTCTQKGLAYINHLFGGNPTQPSLTVIK